MQKLAQTFKCLSDPIRLRILILLQTEGELCVCDLMAVLKLPQSTVSRHLAYLKRSGWLDDRRNGVWMYYTISHANNLLAADLLDLLKRHGSHSSVVSEDRISLAEFQVQKQSSSSCAER
ncbi:MAG: metalloregulator ArsR/SmtB family transcription factor [Desulfuromonadales bacterium]|nr:metalloregulator ArsR/SmtB family transcription factor [Desulfuromonadales bacterium]